MESTKRKELLYVRKLKAFFFSLFGTLAVIVPIYLAAAAVMMTRSAPVDTVQSGIPIAQPTAGDARTFLLMTGTAQPETFVLLRFDARSGEVCTAALPGEAVMLADGQPLTLAEAAEQAGPAQAAAVIEETLSVEVDHYLYCTADALVDLTKDFGTARIPLSNYLSVDALAELRLSLPGVDTVTLTPRMFADVLAADAAEPDLQTLLRAEGYLAFLRVGSETLADTVPDALRAALANSSTNLTAVALYDYERIFGFLFRDPPQYRVGVIPGTWARGRYELAENAPAVAASYFVREPAQGTAQGTAQESAQ